jgi:beta-lactam-binding protein with PASTA domain
MSSTFFSHPSDRCTTSDTLPLGARLRCLTHGCLTLIAALLLTACPTEITVPDLSGLDATGAETALVNLGLTLGIVGEAHSPTVPQGQVISQSPAAGETVAASTPVSIVVSKGPAPIVLPDLVQLPLAYVLEYLEDLGLSSGAITERLSDTVDVDAIISQDPVAGTPLSPGTKVNLVVSLGKPRVPLLLGLSTSAADNALTVASLTLGAVTEAFDEEKAPGIVLSQEPAAETLVLLQSPVNLVVSKGPAPRLVPDLTGLTREAAETALNALALEVGAVSEEYSAAYDAGLVVRHSPPADSSVARNSAVELVLSLGDPPVEIPDLAGLTELAALQLLTEAGLRMGTIELEYSDTVAVGVIISQTPAAGGTALPGTAISIQISKGVRDTVVPPLTGLTRAAAETALEAARLILGTVTYAYDAEVPERQIISQSPPADTVLLPGMAVDIVVSLGAESAPEVSFSGTPINGKAPLTVQFTDATQEGSSPIIEWEWDLEDDVVSSERNPQHTFLDAGLHSIRLSVATEQAIYSLVRANYIYVAPLNYTRKDVAAGIWPSSAAVADFNKDGFGDVAVQSTGKIKMNFGPAIDTGFTSTLTITTSVGYAVCAGDFNGDDNEDLAYVDLVEIGDVEVSQLLVQLGDGAGNFAAPVDTQVSPELNGFITGDFNQDDALDLFAVYINATSTGALFLGKGDGTFEPGSTVTLGTRSDHALAADFNEDGLTDIATIGSYSNDRVSVLLNLGGGAFDTPRVYRVGGTPQQGAVGDLDGDGHLDIITANYDSSDLSVLKGAGDGTFGADTRIKLSYRPIDVKINDLNRDGFMDILYLNSAVSNHIGIFMGKPDGTYWPLRREYLIAYASQLLLTDLDANSYADIIVLGASRGGMSILRENP